MRATRRRTPTPSTASAATALRACRQPRRLRRWSASRRGNRYQSVMARTRAARVSVGRGRAGVRLCLINRLALDQGLSSSTPLRRSCRTDSRRCFANAGAPRSQLCKGRRQGAVRRCIPTPPYFPYSQFWCSICGGAGLPSGQPLARPLSCRKRCTAFGQSHTSSQDGNVWHSPNPCPPLLYLRPEPS